MGRKSRLKWERRAIHERESDAVIRLMSESARRAPERQAAIASVIVDEWARIDASLAASREAEGREEAPRG